MAVYMDHDFYGVIRDVVSEKLQSWCCCCRRKNEQQKQVHSIFERTIQQVRITADLDEKRAKIKQGMEQLRQIDSENDRVVELIDEDIRTLEVLFDSLYPSPQPNVLVPQIVLVNPSPDLNHDEKVAPENPVRVAQAPVHDSGADEKTAPENPVPVEESSIPPAPEMTEVVIDKHTQVSKDFSQELRKGAAAKLAHLAQTRPYLSEASLKALSPRDRIRYGYRKAFLEAAKELCPRDVEPRDWQRAITVSYYQADPILGTEFGWADTADGFQPNLKDFVYATACNKQYVTGCVWQHKKSLSQKAESIANKYAKNSSSTSCALPPQVSEKDVGKKNLKRNAHSVPIWEGKKEELPRLEPQDGLTNAVRDIFESFPSPYMRSQEIGPAPIFEANEIAEFMTTLVRDGAIAVELAQEMGEGATPDLHLVQTIANQIKGMPEESQELAFAPFSLMQQLWLLEQIKDDTLFGKLSNCFIKHFVQASASAKEKNNAEAVAYYLKKYSEDKSVGRLYRSLCHMCEEAKNNSNNIFKI